jgi:hypothetical protein
LILTRSLVAQSYSFKNYTTNDGLVQTDITDIKQDNNGNIWIGTNGGISIFDGKRFTNYDDYDLLQSLRINALLCDSSGIMWIATQNGLLTYKNGFKVFFKPNANQKNSVSCLTSSSHNQLLFVCNNAVYQVRKGKVEAYPINPQIDNNVAYIAFDRNDRLWIVTSELKVYRKTFAGLKSIVTPFTPEERRRGLGILKILGREADRPYFVTNFGTLWEMQDSLHYFNKQYPQYTRAKIGQATYVLEENDTTLWVGGVMGLSKLSGSTTTRYIKENGFCDNSVSCIFTDRERNLWIGCTYNGVYKLSNEALFHLKPAMESYDLRHVSAIAPLANGATLLSTWGQGLYLYKKDAVSKIDLPYYVRYITEVYPFEDYTYIGWFGSGVWKMENKTFKTSLVTHFGKGEAVDRIFKAGPNLAVQTLNNTCYLTDDSLNIKVAVTLPEDYFITVVKDKIYLISPFGQVDELNDQLKPIKKNVFPEISSRITEIACYRNNLIVGTFGQGLYLYDQRMKFKRKVDKKSGLNTNIVTGLLVDGNQLYIGSNLGMIKADLPQLQNMKVFKESEGMFNWECRQNGLQKLPDGAIMIATTNGPYVYYPARDYSQSQASAILSIASFCYGEKGKRDIFFSPFNSIFTITDPINYSDNQVVIKLKGISQRNPDDVLYHYQLKGYDSAWVTTSDPDVTFTELQPGDYQFKTFLSLGGFQSKPLQITFSIAKPLSGQLWFQVLLILFLSAICWFLLTLGNKIYQKYIQTRMVGKLESTIATKQSLTAHAISFAQHHYKDLNEALRGSSKEKRLEYLTPVFLKDIGHRIELLWKNDKITLGEFHQYFDELASAYDVAAKVYHKKTVDSLEMPMTTAFHLLQILSLYFFIEVYESSNSVFSLDTEKKSNGQILIRFYNVTHESKGAKTQTYHFLKETISGYRHPDLNIDVIENLEFGNMILAELNLQNENQL